MRSTALRGAGSTLAILAALALGGPNVATAAGMYDGAYHGTLTAGGMNAMNCAKSAPVQMTVTDNKLEYNHMGRATITATVAADGSFSGSGQNNYAGGSRSAQMQVQTIEGKIANGAILAETKVGNACTYKLELRKFR